MIIIIIIMIIIIIITMTSSRVCITVENSPSPSNAYIRLCKHRKKFFYCFYKITLPRKNSKTLFYGTD